MTLENIMNIVKNEDLSPQVRHMLMDAVEKDIRSLPNKTIVINEPVKEEMKQQQEEETIEQNPFQNPHDYQQTLSELASQANLRNRR